jgi:hypothetical protein
MDTAVVADAGCFQPPSIPTDPWVYSHTAEEISVWLSYLRSSAGDIRGIQGTPSMRRADYDHQRPQAELKQRRLRFGGSALGGSVCMAALSVTASSRSKGFSIALRGRTRDSRSLSL